MRMSIESINALYKREKGSIVEENRFNDCRLEPQVSLNK